MEKCFCKNILETNTCHEERVAVLAGPYSIMAKILKDGERVFASHTLWSYFGYNLMSWEALRFVTQQAIGFTLNPFGSSCLHCPTRPLIITCSQHLNVVEKRQSYCLSLIWWFTSVARKNKGTTLHFKCTRCCRYTCGDPHKTPEILYTFKFDHLLSAGEHPKPISPPISCRAQGEHKGH